MCKSKKITYSRDGEVSIKEESKIAVSKNRFRLFIERLESLNDNYHLFKGFGWTSLGITVTTSTTALLLPHKVDDIPTDIIISVWSLAAIFFVATVLSFIFSKKQHQSYLQTKGYVIEDMKHVYKIHENNSD